MDKTTNQQTNQLMKDTTVIIKGHKKGIANLFMDVTWPVDPHWPMKTKIEDKLMLFSWGNFPCK